MFYNNDLNKKTVIEYIILIDDDEPTNFLNQIIIKKTKCSKNILTIQNAKLALDFIKSKEMNSSLIFLDINMPDMDGWEFIESYKKLDTKIRDKITLIMLTTSRNPDDQIKAGKYKEIKSFLHKPLTRGKIHHIIKNNYKIN